jgi:hypothetical protein
MAIAISTSPPNLSMLRKFNVWYSVKDGNFNDPNIWISNGKKKHNYPQAGDDVYIDHVVTFNIQNPFVRNLYISGNAILGNGLGGPGTLSISGNLQVSGTFDLSNITDWLINLNGVNNYINTFIPGTHNTIYYSRLGDQDIMNLAYCNLSIGGLGHKNLFGSYIISGVTTISDSVTVVKKTNDKLTFGGLLSSSNSVNSTFDNTINADIEFQGGIGVDQRGLTLNLGTGNIYFNGNQTISIGGGSPFQCYNTCLIKGSSVVTIGLDISQGSPFVVNGSINGETSSSTLNIDGGLFQTTLEEPMNIGIYNYNHSSNSYIGYVFNGNYTLPYTNYQHLSIKGTGIKTLSNDTIVNKNLTIFSGNLELSSYNLTVTGTTHLSNATVNKNSSSGYTLFADTFSCDSGCFITFNNPCVIEFRNSLLFDVGGHAPLTFASGVLLKFTTNNQFIDSGHGSNQRWDCDILISGAITLTNQNWGFGITGTINGDTALSIFNNTVLFSYKNALQPMQTGVLVSNSASSKNTFMYELAGNQDITSGTYYNLTIQGSGTKKLLGNVSVLNNYTITSPATLNLNGYILANP